jgi:transcriptional antiterminator NusG
MSLSWYVVQVATNMEDRVQVNMASIITKRLDELKATNQKEKLKSFKLSFGIDVALHDSEKLKEFLTTKVILVPKEKIEEIKNGKKYETERKIFPGYVLVNMEYSDEHGLLIKRVPKVAGFVGISTDFKPVPISQKEVDGIFNQVNQSKEKAKYKVEFEVGEKIRVIDGPFIDFNAIIEEVNYNKTRLKVNVQIFGRETSVELEFGQVEKLA